MRLQAKFRNVKNMYTKGFSLIETLVVVALAAILAGLAAPSFEDMFRRFRVDTVREEFIATVNLARGESIRLGQRIAIRRNCNSNPANDWSCGWSAFVDLDGDTTLDAGETVVHESAVAPGTTVIKQNSAVSPSSITIDRFGQVTQLGQDFRFYPTASGLTAAYAQVVCFTTGTRIRTIKNATTCS